ncbi:MAG: 50S ribosomal protein L6 [Candidatus Njordarchaeales archaeon]
MNVELLTDEKAILEGIKNPWTIGIDYEEIPIPENVKVKIEGKRVIVEGPKGRVEKDFSHVRDVYILQDENKIIVASPARKDKQIKPLGTVATKIRKMIEGVQRWFIYKHKVVYAHFPIRVRVEGRYIVIENFYGRKDKIKVPIVGDQTVVEVTLQPGSDIPDEVIIKGPDLEAVSQTSANLQEACKLRGKFRKDPRVFQDGIWRYVVTREGEE